MDEVRITTQSGAVYDITRGLCIKTDHHGYVYAPFKVWTTKAVDPHVKTWDEVKLTPEGSPQVGKRMYVSGRESYWLSTIVKSIEE